MPRRVPHRFRISNEKDAHVLTHVLPGRDVGFVGMMLEMGVPAKSPYTLRFVPPNFEKLTMACKKNGIDILGPLPE